MVEFKFSLMLVEPTTFVNNQSARALPSVDKCICHCLCDRQESKSNKFFRSRIICFFFLSARIVLLYRHRKLGHHFGTKASKNLIVLISLIYKMSVLSKFFLVKSILENEIKYYFLKYT